MASATGTRGYPVEVHDRAGRHPCWSEVNLPWYAQRSGNLEARPINEGAPWLNGPQGRRERACGGQRALGSGRCSGCRMSEPVGSDMGVTG